MGRHLLTRATARRSAAGLGSQAVWTISGYPLGGVSGNERVQVCEVVRATNADHHAEASGGKQMTKLTSMVMAAALLVPTAVQASPKVMYPDFYELHWRLQQCFGKKVFNCDYTSKTCLSGYSLYTSDFTGVVLAEDRKTVLAHVVAAMGLWFNVDTGEVRARDTGVRIHQDEEFLNLNKSDQQTLTNWRNGKTDDGSWFKCTNPDEPPPE